MQINDRVQFIEDLEDTEILLGTVERIGEAVIRVRWDNATIGHFLFGTALYSLRVVTGDAAVRRHEFHDTGDTRRCIVCGVEQTGDTRLLPCFKWAELVSF